jgi:hypothetical protein
MARSEKLTLTSKAQEEGIDSSLLYERLSWAYVRRRTARENTSVRQNASNWNDTMYASTTLLTAVTFALME